MVAGLSPGTLLSPPPQPWHREEPLTTFAQPGSPLSSSRGLVSDPDVCSSRINVLIPNGNVYPASSLGPQPPGTPGTFTASRLWLRGRPEMGKHALSTPTHVHGQGHQQARLQSPQPAARRKNKPWSGRQVRCSWRSCCCPFYMPRASRKGGQALPHGGSGG